MSDNSAIVSKVWAFCNTLRDDGVGYGDCLELLKYSLGLKMFEQKNMRYPKYFFNWSYKKRDELQEQEVEAMYKWMKQLKLVPTGFGKLISSQVFLGYFGKGQLLGGSY